MLATLRSARPPGPLEIPNVEVCARAMPTSVGQGLAAWGAGNPFEVAGRPDAFFASLQEILATTPPNRKPGSAIFDWLLDDIWSALAWFSERTATTSPMIRFVVGVSPQCRKFHVDFVAARAICTYNGPGTLWVDDAHVDRAALARLIPCAHTANAAIVPDPTAVRQARTGDLLLLRGANHPSRLPGAVHRSPDVSEVPTEGRVLLTITDSGATI